MIESFRFWLEELGLADRGIADPGAPKIRNKKIYNKFKIPDISTYSYERDRGMANAVESRLRKKMSIPQYKFDVTQTTSTRLDPGS